MGRETHEEHLSFAILNRIADRELGEGVSPSALSHVGSCAACRQEVEFIRALGSGIRELHAGVSRAQFLEDILSDASGDEAETFRPRRPSGRARPVGRRWIGVAAGVVGIFAAGLLLSPDRAMAGASLLRFGETRAGALTLRYEAIYSLAAESRLRARLRYWVPDSLRFAQTEPGYAEVELTREGIGRFEGVVSLPPGTVYAMASVEGDAGDRIDTNFGAFWEYLERDETGQPTLRARRYSLLAAEMFARSGVVDAARTAASEFPGRPEFWATLVRFELNSVPAAQRDSVIGVHAARYDLLDAEVRSRGAGPEEMYALSSYARLLGRPERETHWRDRLALEYPWHEYAAQARRSAVMLSPISNLERLAALDRDWELAPMPATAQLALSLSFEFADPVLTAKWLERHAATSVLRDLDHDVRTAQQLAAVPQLRELAETWINDRLDGASDWRGRERGLDQSRRSFAASIRGSRARLNLALARLRFADGELLGSREAVERAVAGDWDPEIFFEAARIHAALGASDHASRLLAFARVDPVAPITSSLRVADAGSALEPTELQLQEARTAFRERVRGTLLRETIDGRASLMSSSGERTTLRQVSGEDLTLIVYALQPRVLPRDAHDLLDANADRLASPGAQMLFITREPGSADSERSVSFQDPEHRVMAALGGFQALQYFVLDAAGDLRYRGDDIASALRVAFALTGDSPPRAEAQTTEGEPP